MLDDSVLGAGEDFDEGVFVEVFQYAHYRQPAYELWDESKFNQVFWLNLAQQLKVALAFDNWLNRLIFFGLEAKRFSAGAPANDFIETDKCAAADKQDIGRVHRGEFLVRMLASTLRRNVGNCAFQNL